MPQHSAGGLLTMVPHIYRPLRTLMAAFPLLAIFLSAVVIEERVAVQNSTDKEEMRRLAHDLFMHGYNGYMRHAYPHDELLPLSCRGRIRGVTPSRGDVDDSLGNFSLTLVDSLDTLVVVGEYEEFERAVRLVVNNVRFDADLVVSVFETNIRMIGGLLSGHIMSLLLKNRDDAGGCLSWYDDQLLRMAADLADRLLPAFNTTSGLPHSRVNLKRGMTPELSSMGDTCTACGGTMLLEWAVLSRLSGNPVYEQKARQAMDFLWNQRNRASDLVGTVLNVHSGDWIRRDSGIGAGIDSYYEYTLKAYILLGEEDYLYRFNRHYEAVMRYLSKGPVFVDVHMHRPAVASRSFMDSLLAFWPGVQVLKGDLRSAIEMHEMLYTVMRRHNGFLPDAFTHDLQVYWAQHPLRPEFIESTYFLYRATRDPHYLQVAGEVLEGLERVKTECGFASIKDVRTLERDDQMESFVLAETLKYLYMIFAEPAQLAFDPDNYVLTTEAHFLPLSIGNRLSPSEDEGLSLPRRMLLDPDEIIGEEKKRRFQSACPYQPEPTRSSHELIDYGSGLRQGMSKMLTHIKAASSPLQAMGVGGGGSCSIGADRMKTWLLNSDNKQHLDKLKKMGIEVEVHPDGRMQLTHTGGLVVDSLPMLQELHALIQEGPVDDGVRRDERVVQIVSEPHLGEVHLSASPALFGLNLTGNDMVVDAELSMAKPHLACTPLTNLHQTGGTILVAQRGGCMFQEKARYAQDAGAVGLIVIDNNYGSTAGMSSNFAMSGDETRFDDIHIPVLFLFHFEGQQLLEQFQHSPTTIVRLSEKVTNPLWLYEEYLAQPLIYTRRPLPMTNHYMSLNKERTKLRMYFRFGPINRSPQSTDGQIAAEKHVFAVRHYMRFDNDNMMDSFLKKCRVLAYVALEHGGATQLANSRENLLELRMQLQQLQILAHPLEVDAVLGRQVQQELLEMRDKPISNFVLCDLAEPDSANFGCRVMESSASV